MKHPNNIQNLKDLILSRTTLTGKEACSILEISQPTFSRLINSINDEILKIDSGRSATYALKRNIANIGTELPVFAIEKNGTSIHIADLKFLKPKGMYVASNSAHIISKLCSDIPYWLDDLRPSGLLGRLIPKKHPELGYADDVRFWNADACIHYWSTLGWDLIGNYIIGERAFELFTKMKDNHTYVVEQKNRKNKYEKISEEILSLGAAGSSAGGEQPKFLAVRSDIPVIVKFASLHSKNARKKDLLLCEYHSLSVLNETKKIAPSAEIITSKNNIFLEIERFDRIKKKGRRGVISLAALDSEFVGSAKSWKEIAKGLFDQKIIKKEVYEQILWRYYFGLCIRNTDMHPGNLSFHTVGEDIIGLTPCYDMLPMAFADEQKIKLLPISLTPNDRHIWQDAIKVAQKFWMRIEKDTEISREIKKAASYYLKILNEQI